MYTIRDLYSLEHTLAGPYLEGFTYPWEALAGIKSLIVSLGQQLPSDYHEVSPQVWVHESATVALTAFLGAPCIIGPETEVRHCAFIRGSALVGADCVVGNSAELKNVIIFNNCETPHYNYVGDSILGFHAHMGAGSITSNIKADRTNIVVKGDSEYVTGRRKIGAIIGDWVEVGCNAVLNPGTVIGQHSQIYPTSCVRGIVKSNTIWKNTGEQVAKREA